MKRRVIIQHFFDEVTWTLSYVVHKGQAAIVIDPVLDYNRNNARTSWTSAENIAAHLDREGRDTELEAPELILPSIQVNIRAGALPEAEAYGTGYLKIPLNVLGKAE